MIKELKLTPPIETRRQSRGRNGFFNAYSITVVETSGQTLIEVDSARPGKEPPIRISLAPDDARKLGEILRGEG